MNLVLALTLTFALGIGVGFLVGCGFACCVVAGKNFDHIQAEVGRRRTEDMASWAKPRSGGYSARDTGNPPGPPPTGPGAASPRPYPCPCLRKPCTHTSRAS